MKQWIRIILIVFFLIPSTLQAAKPTGHNGFTSITFQNGGKLISHMTTREIERGYEALGRGLFFGWKDHYFYIQEEIHYVGEILFSKSNRTSVSYTLDYESEEVHRKEVSTRITGTASTKIKGDIKKAQVEGNGSVTGEKKDTTTVTKKEVVKMKIVLAPNRKITYQITGEGVLTSGVSRFYALGIRFKQGVWEYIEIHTAYYEMIEEEIE